MGFTAIKFLLLVVALGVSVSAEVKFFFHSPSDSDVLHDLDIEIGHTSVVVLQANSVFTKDTNLSFVYEKSKSTHSDKLSYDLSSPTVKDGVTTWRLTMHAHNPGYVTFTLQAVNGSTHNYSTEESYIRVQLYHSQAINVVSQVIGWIYFVAWSISFYPQIYINFRRKSVIGLNFDFLLLNVLGFLCYSVYNISLFWIPTVQHEYHQAHPHDVIPVEVNDVVFALHAFFITCVTIGQTAIYERGTQKVSKICIGIASLAVLAIFIFIILAAVPSVATFNWLSMVYGFSYVKLGITIIKYMPQAWMNYRRKSTVGWSIGNILLDFTGGTGSILQMLLLAYNFNDWASIFTNPAKFWLGALSILFDILFMVQHYILYRNRLEDYERI